MSRVVYAFLGSFGDVLYANLGLRPSRASLIGTNVIFLCHSVVALSALVTCLVSGIQYTITYLRKMHHRISYMATTFDEARIDLRKNHNQVDGQYSLVKNSDNNIHSEELI